jgi:hypothetical protein
LRGRIRSKSKEFISSNETEEVETITQRAFQEMGDNVTPTTIVKAGKVLLVLRGIGPATAMMVLQTVSDAVPSMSQEAMLEVFDGEYQKVKYTWKMCEAFIGKINEVAEQLGNGKNCCWYLG